MITIEQIRPELTWRLRQRVLYPERKLYEMEMDEDNYGYHFAAFKDNDIIAVVSLFKKEDDWQFRKFAVDSGLQNMGIGKAMLQHITDFAITGGGTRLWCNARDTAIGFYLKYGFTHTGQLFSKNGFNYEILEKRLIPSSNQQ
ncbi:GNAT family N-acetyltransferase [Mucilaginibacter celer]|uniref:GNAT family N-acetyltransferase n=1 Tax=Mucilaginibacter celer TaxID=2305508 RepID=A0A494VTN0_9SPHI|nr:GNAT family N-acetyltransferase [Mucilaginibacter celer]AYL98936.1 GNAT family N-acetyltransferase [Mucilaginibacter celer]